VGTLESNFGDLGLYDMRLAQVLTDTVGAQARYRTRNVEFIAGLGDAGWAMKGSEYNTVYSGGATARVNFADRLELGGGGQLYGEPEVVGNRYAPHSTPGVSYEDYVRGEVVERWIEENPGQLADFPDPQPTDASSWKVVGYLGFGNLGLLRWNAFYANYTQLHPKGHVSESYDGETVDVYIAGLTDERAQLHLGDEMQLTLVPDRWDLILAGLYGNYTDGDNDIAPSDDDRTFLSGVLRTQLYVTPTFHLLAEYSVGREESHNGNEYREHVDSLSRAPRGSPTRKGSNTATATRATRYSSRAAWC
jgi:hypothetical protein